MKTYKVVVSVEPQVVVVEADSEGAAIEEAFERVQERLRSPTLPLDCDECVVVTP